MQGWGYGTLLAVELARDIMKFDSVRFIVNTGPNMIGPLRGENFTVCPAIVALSPRNVGLWLGRADGYRVSDFFAFGINTAVRLGCAANGTYALRDPCTQQVAPPMGPWGSFSQLMVDQCQIGLHLVWPHALSNRISNAQLQPALWDGTWVSEAGGNHSFVGVGNLSRIAREAAILVEHTHSRANNGGILPIFLISNLYTTSFYDPERFGHAARKISSSNGRAFVAMGDAVFEVSANLSSGKRMHIVSSKRVYTYIFC